MDLKQLTLDVFYTLIFPGFLFTAVAGLFLTWVDRKVTAVIQSRVGPPWFQPYADIGKLMTKKMVIPRGSSSLIFLTAPLIAIAGSTLSGVIVFRALLEPSAGFVGDIIVLIYLSALPAIALIIGGSASRSPFGAIGASREMSMVLAYEIVFLLSIVVVLIKTRSILFSNIVLYQSQNGPIAFSISGFLAMLIMLFCIQAKLGFLPFDISEAETELIGGPLAEYSGSGLALFKISRAMMFLYLPVLVVLLFMGSTEPNPLSILSLALKVLLILVILIVSKITHARLKLDQMLQLFWGKLAIIGLVAIIFALLGL